VDATKVQLTPWPCSAAAATVLSTVPAVPVCCGPINGGRLVELLHPQD